MKKKIILSILVVAAFMVGAIYMFIKVNEPKDFYAKHDIEEQNIKKMVASLEDTLDETEGLNVSIKPSEIIFSDQEEEVSKSINDEFYLSIAPYIKSSHDCFHHNLISCRGELANQKIHVRILDDNGKSLFDKDVKTYSNGFYGIWLPKDIVGTIRVTYGDKMAQSPISTSTDDPTCLTTLKLE